MNTKRPGTKSMAFRLPIDLAQRLEAAAALLATDPSHLLRMMIAEHLPEYEERAKRTRRTNPDQGGGRGASRPRNGGSG